MYKTFRWIGCFLPLFTSAQQIKLSGNVKAGNRPLSGGSVLLSAIDGNRQWGTSTDTAGHFTLTAPAGKYRLRVSALGAKEFDTLLALMRDTSVGTIFLQEDANKLEDVVVTGKKRLVEFRADRMTYQVENNAGLSGADGLQTLQAVPGLLLQQDQVSILGKGAARILVNGRPVELTGAELASYLKTLAAADIKSIEVMSNPPAGYDAGGNGVINILLKKARANSWKNVATLTYDQNTYPGMGLRDQFLYSKGRFRLAMNAGGQGGHRRVIQELDTYYPDGPLALRYTGKERTANASGRLAIDYALDSRTTVGIQYQGSHTTPGSRDDTYIGSKDSLLVNRGYRDLQQSGHTFNVHLITALDTLGRKLSFDGDYFTYKAAIDNRFRAERYLPDGSHQGTSQSAINSSSQRIRNSSLKVDMEHPLKGASLTYGARYMQIESHSDIVYYNTITGTPELDPARTDVFSYRETGVAAYLSGTKKLHKKLTLQLGLRLEHTNTKGQSMTAGQSNRTSYTKLFPTVYADYLPGNDHRWLFSYGRRINRPGFSLLNPFRSYISSNSYSEGNPFLQPSFSDNFDLTYIYKGTLRTNGFFNRLTAGFGPVFSSDPTTQTLIISRRNYYNEHYFGLGITYSANVTAWWQLQGMAYLLGSNSRFNSSVDARPQNGLQGYGSLNNSIRLGKGASLQVDYQYRTPFRRGLYRFGYMAGLNIGWRQQLLRNKWQIAFLANDVFNTAYLKGYTSVVNGIKQVYNENNSSRFFRLTLTYTIGNDKIKVAARNFGNEEEQRRSN